MTGVATSRYDTIVKLASGGMATVWVGTVRGALGFRQLVAIKRPHPHLLEDTSYRNELVTEARLASLINHANVIDVRDVEVDGDTINLVMDYIEGASLGDLIVAAAKRDAVLSPRVAVRVALDALAGMHAAHELVDERGRHVGLVHRDISPQNIVVGVDGLSRVADFGVAKFARKNADSTEEGSLKGKLAYMAPEYLRGETIDRRFDIFALGIVLWESLAGKRLFRGANEAETLRMLLEHEPESLATAAPGAAPLAGVVATALSRAADARFQNALAMASALESTAIAAGLCGGHTEVAAALKDLVGPMIEERRALIRAKLADEPSLASLMGVPPMPGVAATAVATPIVPPTMINAPLTFGVPATVAAATPKLGGGLDDAPGGRTVPLAPAAMLAPLTSIPSTKPMTPRMEGAPNVQTLRSDQPPPPADDAGAKNFTLPSASPAAMMPAAPVAATMLAAAPAPAPARAIAPRVENSGETQLSFNEPSARTARTGHDLEPALPRNRTLPVALGIAGTVAVVAAIAFAATRPRTPHPLADPSTSAAAGGAGTTSAAAAASANAPPSAAAAGPSATAPPATSIMTLTPATSAAATAPAGRRAHGGIGGNAKSTAAATTAQPAPPGTTPPVVPPAETSKKPPPNPYANE